MSAIEFGTSLRETDGTWPAKGGERPYQETSPEEIPGFLKEKAKGQFPLIEKYLAENHGLSLPSELTVADFISAMAFASAEIIRDQVKESQPREIEFHPLPQRVVIIDDKKLHEMGQIMVLVRTDINSGYTGIFFFPDSPSRPYYGQTGNEEPVPGMPFNFLSQYSPPRGDPEGLVFNRLVIQAKGKKNLTPLGEELLDKLGQKLAETDQ